MYSDVIFTSLSVMYDKEAKCASLMTTNGLLTNQFSELNDAPWAGVLQGEDQDKDSAANVALFAVQCYILHVDSLFRTSIGSISGRPSQPMKDACPHCLPPACPLVTTNASIIDLEKILMGISLPQQVDV